MRYNEDAWEYDKTINQIKGERKFQKDNLKKLEKALSSIKKFEEDEKVKKYLALQENKQVKKYLSAKNDAKILDKEIKNSDNKIYYLEQKICAHDFGVSMYSYNDYYEGEIRNGYCLECGKEINDVKGRLFTHEIYIDEELVGTMTINEFKQRFEELKRLYNYDKSSDKFELGEKIIEELTKDAKIKKKSRK